jgi:hypothetical protein
MEPVQLKLIMDQADLNDRGLGEKLGVSHSSVIRWRKAGQKIPTPVAIAINSILGGNINQSALDIAKSNIEEKWEAAVFSIEPEDLWLVAGGILAISYRDGDFHLKEFSERDDSLAYVGDVCGVIGLYSEGVDLVAEICPDLTVDSAYDLLDENLPSVNHIATLLGEAQRVEMLKHDIYSSVLDILNMQAEDQMAMENSQVG